MHVIVSTFVYFINYRVSQPPCFSESPRIDILPYLDKVQTGTPTTFLYDRQQSPHKWALVVATGNFRSITDELPQIRTMS